MPSLLPASMGDLLKMTLADLGEPKVTDLSTDLQDFIAMRILLKQNQVKIDSGTKIQFNARMSTQSNFGYSGMYASDITNVADQQVQAEVPWRIAKTSFAVDEYEMAYNRDPRKIIDMLTDRRYGCMVDQAEGMENSFWKVPAASVTNEPYGVPYYVVKSATRATTSTNNGFNGLMPSGYTDVANLSTTTYPRWANAAGSYVDISYDDLVQEWVMMSEVTKFTPPVARPAEPNTGDKYGYFTTRTVRAQLARLLRSQNDNLGDNIAAKNGDVMFNSTPVTWVPKLDEDTTGPVYGLNFGVFKTYILKGYWMREVQIERTPGKHTVSTVFFDSSFQWVCKDRRRNFVLSTGTTMP